MPWCCQSSFCKSVDSSYSVIGVFTQFVRNQSVWNSRMVKPTNQGPCSRCKILDAQPVLFLFLPFCYLWLILNLILPHLKFIFINISVKTCLWIPATHFKVAKRFLCTLYLNSSEYLDMQLSMLLTFSSGIVLYKPPQTCCTQQHAWTEAVLLPQDANKRWRERTRTECQPPTYNWDDRSAVNVGESSIHVSHRILWFHHALGTGSMVWGSAVTLNRKLWGFIPQVPAASRKLASTFLQGLLLSPCSCLWKILNWT